MPARNPNRPPWKGNTPPSQRVSFGEQTWVNFRERRRYLSTDKTWDKLPPTNGLVYIDFGPQSGSTNKIDLGDSRIQNAVYRNGLLWCVHSVYLPAGGSPTQSVIQYWKIDPAAQKVVLVERLGGPFAAYPSIAVNRFNDWVINYCTFAENQFASADYTIRQFFNLDNPAPNRLWAGEGSYFKTGDGVKNRWGDYSAALVDPINDTDFWLIQEHAAPPVGSGENSGRWATRWGHFDLPKSANDNFNGPTVVTGSEAILPGTFLRATREPGEPAHLSTTDHSSVWFRWTAPTNGLAYAWEDDDGTQIKGINVYTGSSLTALNWIADSLSAPFIGGGANVYFNALGGTTYQIVCTSSPNGGNVPFRFALAQPSAPGFALEPKDTNALAGNSASFSCYAWGSPVPSLQWRFNGAPISGATNSTFTISSVQQQNEGLYSVLATNYYGSSTSSNAFLKFYPSAAAPLSNPVYTNAAFQLTLTSVAGYNYIIQASSDLKNWAAISTNQAPFTFTDSGIDCRLNKSLDWKRIRKMEVHFMSLAAIFGRVFWL